MKIWFLGNLLLDLITCYESVNNKYQRVYCLLIKQDKHSKCSTCVNMFVYVLYM